MYPMKLPKLHIRDLFWLVMVCALAVGWWVDHRTQALKNLGFGQQAALWRQRAHWLAFAVQDSYEIAWTKTEMGVRRKGMKSYYHMTTQRYVPSLEIDEQPLPISVQNGQALSTWEGEPATVLPDDYR